MPRTGSNPRPQLVWCALSFILTGAAPVAACDGESCGGGGSNNGASSIPYRTLGPVAGYCPVGNPIDPGTGNKYLVERDYEGSGHFPLTLARYYNSKLPGALPTGTFFLVADFTTTLSYDNWTHGYIRGLAIPTTTSNGKFAVAVRGDGRRIVFQYSSAQSAWQPAGNQTNGNTPDALTELVGAGGREGWLYHDGSRGELEHYNVYGRLESIESLAGYT